MSTPHVHRAAAADFHPATGFGALISQLSPDLPGAGMPQERLARLAARHAFVRMKQRFMAALAGLEGARADWLREHVRHTHQPVDLWLLRRSVFEQLKSAGQDGQRLCAELDHQLDSVFPEEPTRAGDLG